MYKMTTIRFGNSLPEPIIVELEDGSSTEIGWKWTSDDGNASLTFQMNYTQQQKVWDIEIQKINPPEKYKLTRDYFTLSTKNGFRFESASVDINGTVATLSLVHKDIARGGHKVKTCEKVIVDGKKRIVYRGIRGGSYIKTNGCFISLRQLK